MSFSLVSPLSFGARVGAPYSFHSQTHFVRIKNNQFFLLNSLPTNFLLTPSTTTCTSNSSSSLQPLQFLSSPPYNSSMSSNNVGSRMGVSSSSSSSYSTSSGNGDSDDFRERTNGTDAETDSDADDDAHVAIPDRLDGSDYGPSSLPDWWDVLGLGEAMVDFSGMVDAEFLE